MGHMAEATVTTKGQITVPAEVRRELGLRPGSRVEFVRAVNGTYEIVPKNRPLASLRGCLARPDVPVSVERMEEAIEAGAADSAR